MLAHSRYRPDIDGLRALAVTIVVLFHLDFPWVQGGFIGVDVFFVISGFLITRVIHRDLSSGQFELKRFYVKRVRRLMPAAVATTVITALFSLLLLPESRLRPLGVSAVASMFSLANFHFWSLSGYFDANSITKPLLHMWSLSVEEQFYLVWPALFLWASRRSGQKTRIVVALGAVVALLASFGATILVMKDDRETAFYFTHLRAWEFGCGILAWRLEGSLYRFRTSRTALLCVGLGLILVPSLLFDKKTDFPGFNALYPCLGTFLVLCAQRPPLAALLLENRLIRWVGKVSYSVYLVHWPLIVLYQAHTLNRLTLLEMVALFFASLLLGYLLWHFVEDRFRRSAVSDPLLSRQFALIFSGLFLLANVGFLVLSHQGGWSRSIHPENEELIAHIQALEMNLEKDTMRGVCYQVNKKKMERCITPKKGKDNILLIGDSHAANILAGFREYFGEEVEFSLAAVAACRPILKATDRDPKCAARNELIFQKADLSKFDLIVMMGNLVSREEINQIPEAISLLRKRGARDIVLLGPVFSYRTDVKNVVERFGAEDPEFLDSHLDAQVTNWVFPVEPVLRRKVEKSGARYISLLRILCPDGTRESCRHRVQEDGPPALRDRWHLTAESTYFFLEEVDQAGFDWYNE